MAHAKIAAPQPSSLASGLPDDPLLEPYLLGVLPGRGRASASRTRRARASAAARDRRPPSSPTRLVDGLGATFVHRVGRDTGSAAAEVARACGDRVGGGRRRAGSSRRSCRGAPRSRRRPTCQLALERVVERVTKWVLGNTDADAAGGRGRRRRSRATSAGSRPRLPDWLAGAEAEAFHKLLVRARDGGHAGAARARTWRPPSGSPGALDVVTVARARGVEPEAAAARYYALGQHVDFAWLFARLGGGGRRGRLAAARGGGARRRPAARAPAAHGRGARRRARELPARAARGGAGAAERSAGGAACEPRRRCRWWCGSSAGLPTRPHRSYEGDPMTVVMRFLFALLLGVLLGAVGMG